MDKEITLADVQELCGQVRFGRVTLYIADGIITQIDQQQNFKPQDFRCNIKDAEVTQFFKPEDTGYSTKSDSIPE